MSKSINEVINQVLEDDLYAEKIKNAALKASETDFGSNEWNVLLKFFIKDSSELIKLETSAEPTARNWGPTTTTTVTTTSTGACTTTTTTTTTTTN